MVLPRPPGGRTVNWALGVGRASVCVCLPKPPAMIARRPEYAMLVFIYLETCAVSV